MATRFHMPRLYQQGYSSSSDRINRIQRVNGRSINMARWSLLYSIRLSQRIVTKRPSSQTARPSRTRQRNPREKPGAPLLKVQPVHTVVTVAMVEQPTRGNVVDNVGAGQGATRCGHPAHRGVLSGTSRPGARCAAPNSGMDDARALCATPSFAALRNDKRALQILRE
jgi:hypothetical protein